METRDRIIEAAAKTLQKVGYVGATARAIAYSGGFNQGLIYYYFNDLDDLFLAVIDKLSAARMTEYLERTSSITDLSELVSTARELFEEDSRTGHITVLSELLAAALPNPKFAKQIAKRMEPWIRFAQQTIERFTQGTFVESLVQPRVLAESFVAHYIGLEAMLHLDGNKNRAKAVFDMAQSAIPILAPFLVRPQ
ncbi:MAG: TetR/AcrR family transcriptional regulator [Actinomycetota bacterium]